ncbi:unnamed protein product [Closterium sp. NIES-54]
MDEANGRGDGAAPIESLACLRCSKPARLQCPKCLELKLPRTNASFCSQECFKASWADHKALHKAPPAGEGAGAGAVAVVAAGAGEGDEVAPYLQQGWLYVLRKGQTRAAKMPPFDWTGPLRPFPVAPRRPVPAHIPRPDWAHRLTFPATPPLLLVVPHSPNPPAPSPRRLTSSLRSPPKLPRSFLTTDITQSQV